jgi:hypothetical protein
LVLGGIKKTTIYSLGGLELFDLNFIFTFWSGFGQWAYSVVVSVVSCGGPSIFLWWFFGLFLGRLDGY